MGCTYAAAAATPAAESLAARERWPLMLSLKPDKNTDLQTSSPMMIPAKDWNLSIL